MIAFVRANSRYYVDKYWKEFMKIKSPQSHENGGVYEIKIKGLLDEHWNQWFERMTLKRVINDETGQEYTLITGSLPDQPALHGLLAKIRDLNLTLLSVQRINLETNKREKMFVEFPSNGQE